MGLLQRGVVWSNQQAAVVVHHLLLLGQTRHRADVFDGFRGRLASFFQSFFVLAFIVKKLKQGTVKAFGEKKQLKNCFDLSIDLLFDFW